MKTLILGAVIAVPAFVLSANAQSLDPARERAVQECSRESSKYSQTTWGSQQLTAYRTCMGQRGHTE